MAPLSLKIVPYEHIDLSATGFHFKDDVMMGPHCSGPQAWNGSSDLDPIINRVKPCQRKVSWIETIYTFGERNEPNLRVWNNQYVLKLMSGGMRVDLRVDASINYMYLNAT